MAFQLSRRSLLAGIGAAAATCALSPIGAMAREDAGGLAYRTAGELVKALADRTISARELLEGAIARIEALDPNINAVVVPEAASERKTRGAKRRAASSLKPCSNGKM